MKKKFKLVCFAAAVFVIISLVNISYNMIMHAVYPVRYYEYIDRYSRKYGLDEYLVMGVIKAESNYIHDAHSGVARGLMQLTEETAVWIAEKIEIEFETDDVENPETNIQMGCYYLKYLIEYYDNNTDVALAAYNAGPGNVSKWLADERYSEDGETLLQIPFEETENYVKKVKEYTKTYRKLYDLGETVKDTVSGSAQNTGDVRPTDSEK